MTLLYAVDVRQSQNFVACPNGGNGFHPTICFVFQLRVFQLRVGGMNPWQVH